MDGLDLLLGVGGIVMALGLAWVVQSLMGENLLFRLRAFLLCLIGGLIAYNLYGLEAPGTNWLQRILQRWAVLLASFIGATLPLGYLGWRWWRRGVVGHGSPDQDEGATVRRE